MTARKNPPRQTTRSAQPRLAAAALVAAALGLLAPASLAQSAGQGATAPGGDYQQPEAGMQGQQAQTEFEPATIDAFVAVLGELHTIRENYAGRIQQSPDAETALQLQQDAQREMVDRVKASDIDLETYNAISMRMNQDPEFARMVVDRATQ